MGMTQTIQEKEKKKKKKKTGFVDIAKEGINKYPALAWYIER